MHICTVQANNAVSFRKKESNKAMRARIMIWAFYSQYMNPSITPTKPALIPAISFPPFEPDFLLLLGDAPVLVLVPVAVAPEVLSVCPRLGSLTSPSTSQPPAVDDGH
jgi:hypothetical protein